MGIKIHNMVVGPVQTNCYLVINEDIKEAICVDPGDRAEAIIEKIVKENLKLTGVFLTHGHFDHILAANELREYFQVKLYANEKEKLILASPDLNLSRNFAGIPTALAADEWLIDGQKITLAGFEIQAIATPGHTEGGMCYYFPKEGVLFSGDTLFCGSMGRTDFPTGDYSTLISSIKEKLLVLPEETKVFPGHDIDTKIGLEKEEFIL